MRRIEDGDRGISSRSLRASLIGGRHAAVTEGSMTEAPKIASCVDCGLTLIGERLRCPACHALHASALTSSPRLAVGTMVVDVEDEAITAPRPRSVLPVDEADGGMSRSMAHWVVVLEVFFIMVLGAILGGRACMP